MDKSSTGNTYTKKNVEDIFVLSKYTDITNQVKTFKWSKRDKNGFLDENWGRLV